MNYRNKLVINSILLFLMFLSVHPVQAKNTSGIENKYLKVKFNDRGIVDIYDKQLHQTVHLAEKQFTIKIDDKIIDGSLIKDVKRSDGNNSVTYQFKQGKYEVKAVYTLQPDWRFVSKQLFVTVTGDSTYWVQGIVMFRGSLSNTISHVYLAGGGRNGAFLRLTNNKKKPPSYGVFFALQNPYMQWHRTGKNISVKYTPDMEWNKNYGTAIFKSDRVMIGVYKLSGQTFPVSMIPEWQYIQNPGVAKERNPQIDYNEIRALSQCVKAFMTYKPEKSVRINIGWCENDYQIDVATQEGRDAYKRIIDQVAAVGGHYILYAPTNSNVSDPKKDMDAWGWENTLWLGLGQKIRTRVWDPNKQYSVPSDIQQMIDYAKSHGIKLVAYVYPTMPWMQNPKWTAWITSKGRKPRGYSGVDTGIPSFQNWFVNLLTAFYKKTGIGGYSFDHWWMQYTQPGTTSKYAQWFGSRRILDTLRARFPNIVIDGRQQYSLMGPWNLLAGSYPHPSGFDEQPQSFRAFPDLSIDRSSADHIRFANWRYRMQQFMPVEMIPGFITHQTPRYDAEGHIHKAVHKKDSKFRIRDWDYMGWKYSLLSSIGTAPFNDVIDYLPARDTSEFKYFSKEDQQWFKHWFNWTDEHIKYMHKLRPIIGQPMLGRIDGTAAIINNKGFVFLFNPNYRAMNGTFTLDQSIGLQSGDKFVIKALHPKDEGYIGAPDGGYWKYGQKVNLSLEGTQVGVFEIIPAEEVGKPLILNVAGNVALKGNTIVASEVRGPIGHTRRLSFIIPKDTKVSKLEINGQHVAFKSKGNVLTAVVKFKGTRFDHAQQVGEYSSTFTGGKYTASFSVPKRIFDQLQRRRVKWPIPYTKDDLKATWLGPSRLLLFIQIADPNPEMKVAMTINGDSVKLKKAYSSVYPNKNTAKRTFMGYYADLTPVIEAGKKYTVTVNLPNMKPGQFQGLFFQNIKTEYTKDFSEVK